MLAVFAFSRWIYFAGPRVLGKSVSASRSLRVAVPASGGGQLLPIVKPWGRERGGAHLRRDCRADLISRLNTRASLFAWTATTVR